MQNGIFHLFYNITIYSSVLSISGRVVLNFLADIVHRSASSCGFLRLEGDESVT